MNDCLQNLFRCPTCDQMSMSLNVRQDGSLSLFDELGTLDVRDMPREESGAPIPCCSFCLPTVKVLRECGVTGPLNSGALRDVMRLVHLTDGEDGSWANLDGLDQKYDGKMLMYLCRLWDVYTVHCSEAAVERKESPNHVTKLPRCVMFFYAVALHIRTGDGEFLQRVLPNAFAPTATAGRS